MKRLKSMMAVLSAVSLLGAAGAAQAGATLDAVKKKGFVQCGVSDGLPGFSYVDAQGKYLGIDVNPPVTLGTRLQGIFFAGLPLGMIFAVYSVLLAPGKKAKAA